MTKIVAIGPESTGKTTLCEQLASHYNTLWCPEFAREYLLEHGTDYSYNDLLVIAKGQINLEESLEKGMKTRQLKLHYDAALAPLFIDTDMYVMKVWCEFVFQNCHRFILDQIVQRKYDLYLLCNIDLPWTADDLREYPDLKTREKLYHIYKDILINQAVPWVEVSGNTDERLNTAIHAVDKLLAR